MIRPISTNYSAYTANNRTNRQTFGMSLNAHVLSHAEEQIAKSGEGIPGYQRLLALIKKAWARNYEVDTRLPDWHSPHPFTVFDVRDEQRVGLFPTLEQAIDYSNTLEIASATHTSSEEKQKLFEQLKAQAAIGENEHHYFAGRLKDKIFPKTS